MSMSILQISDSELAVMKVLWENSPRMLPEIVIEVRKTRSWGDGTVKTLLSRLVKKNAVRQEGVRRLYRYWPLVSCEQYAKSVNEQLLALAIRCEPAAMLNFFVDNERLTGGDIAELRRILDAAEAKLS